MKAILLFLVLGWVVPFFKLNNPPVTSVSFQLARKFIIVQASVDGGEGLFILDTGVSDVILNSRHFEGQKTGGKFYGISGIEMEEEILFIRFNIGGFEKKVVAKITNFNALEKFTGLELFGVVGNGIFTNCEVVLDYTFKELTIYPLDKSGNPISSKYIHQEPQDTLSFYLARGVPYVEVIADGQLLRMIVDSGATANVMDPTKIDRLNVGSDTETEGSLTGFGPHPVSAKFQRMDKLIVGNLSCPPMKTIFLNLDHLNQSKSRKSMDGILGYEFLRNFRVAINFRKKEIYLWNRETVEMQWAIADQKSRNNPTDIPIEGVNLRLGWR